LSIDHADTSVDRARSAYSDISYLGLCDEGYALPGSEPCSDLRGAFVVVDSGNTEGNYGKVNGLKEEIVKLKSNLKDDAPDMGPFYSSMALIWDTNHEGNLRDGIVTIFTSLESRAIKAKADAEYEYDFLHGSVQTKRSSTDSTLSSLKGQKLNLIDRAPEGFAVHSTGTISERLRAMELSSEKIGKKLADAETQRIDINSQGYLAGSILLLQDVEDGYVELAEALDQLEADAIQTTDQQKEEAESEISRTEKDFRSQAPSPHMEAIFQDAKDLYDSADSLAIIGDRYEAYEEAAALARSARSEPGLMQSAEQSASLAELEGLIQRAEADEINVVSQKELLALLEDSSLDVSVYVDDAIDSISEKARIKYDDDLMASRARIIDKLSLAGYAAADLETDMRNSEAGIVQDGHILYPEAIGSLRVLASDYAQIEATLDLYMSDIVGNTMSISADPIIVGATLDRPAEIQLDLQLSNDRPYGAANANAKVRMSYALPFLYSDISQGRDEVESILMEDKDKTISLFLTSVEPYESKRIIFTKSQVVARTLSRSVSAEGTGYGSADVEKEIEFQLDYPVLRFEAPYGYSTILIDGYPPGKALPAGKHGMILEKTVVDAYEESISDIKAYSMGLNSKVEYTYTISPLMDLDSLLLFIDSMDDEHVSSLNVVAVTGEKITDKQRVSDTQMTMRINGLDEGRDTILKVTYLVSDTQEYVASQIDAMDAAPLSDEAQEILDSAKLQATSGGYERALELIEEAKAQSAKDEKAQAKIQDAYDKLEKEFLYELGQIDAALEYRNLTGTLHDRLISRKSELEQAISKAQAADPDDGIEILERLDKNWLSKEMTAFRKEVYKGYGDLKERFLAAGNTTTPQEFLDLESALIRFDTGGKLEYALDVAWAYGEAQALVDAQESMQSANQASSSASFNALKAQVEAVLEDYLLEQASAKGTEYASYFAESESSIDKKVDAASKAISGDPRLFSQKMDELSKAKDRMSDTLASLEKEATAKHSMVKALLSEAQLDGSAKARLEGMLDDVQDMLDSGEYVNALRASSAISKDLESSSKDGDSGLLLLGLAALSVIVTLAVYILKHKEEDGGKKPLRRLERIGASKAEQNPPEDAKPASKGVESPPEMPEKEDEKPKGPGLKDSILELLG